MGGAIGYLAKPSPAAEKVTVTETVEKTETVTVTSTLAASPTTTPSKTVAPIRFSYWDYHPERIDSHIAKFEEEYGISVETASFQSYPAYQSATQTKLLAGESYDVLYAMTDYQLKWYTSGWARTVEGLPDADTIKKSFYEGWLPSYVTPEGELLALPYFCAFYDIYLYKRISA